MPAHAKTSGSAEYGALPRALEMEGSEAAVISGQEAAGVPGVNLAHVIRVWRGVRRERGTDFSHEGKGGLRRGPQSQHLACSPKGLLKPCLLPRGATNIDPGTAS